MSHIEEEKTMKYKIFDGEMVVLSKEGPPSLKVSYLILYDGRIWRTNYGKNGSFVKGRPSYDI